MPILHTNNDFIYFDIGVDIEFWLRVLLDHMKLMGKSFQLVFTYLIKLYSPVSAPLSPKLNNVFNGPLTMYIFDLGGSSVEFNKKDTHASST